jgi:hypothetical protein
MAGRRPSTVEMRTPAIASAMAHVFFLAADILNLDFFSRPPLMEPEPVMVDFEAIDKKAAAPTVGNPPPQPKDVPIAQETTKAPPPKSAEPPPAPPQPKPEPVVEQKPPPPPPKPEEKPKAEAAKPVEDLVALKPKEPEPPKVEKPPEPPKPAEVKKPEPPKPPPPKPPQPKQDRVDSLLDDILKNKQSPSKVQTPEQQPKPPQQVTRQAPAAPNLANVVTASEIEGVRQKIRPCWNTQGGARDQAMVITLVVEMSQNGTPVKAELREPGRYNSDPVYRAAADAAHRAIMNPRCQPWPLSPEKFSSWKTITFNFDPRDY